MTLSVTTSQLGSMSPALAVQPEDQSHSLWLKLLIVYEVMPLVGRAHEGAPGTEAHKALRRPFTVMVTGMY
jgi:hypothetical protein